jgi:hypothetical protein
MSKKYMLDMLIQALQVLGSEYEQQVASFPTFVVIPDELALGFNDAFLLLDQLVTDNLISVDKTEVLYKITESLSALQQDSNRWTLEALRDSAEWKQIRSLAREALLLLGITLEPATVSHIHYIRSRSSIQ